MDALYKRVTNLGKAQAKEIAGNLASSLSSSNTSPDENFDAFVLDLDHQENALRDFETETLKMIDTCTIHIREWNRLIGMALADQNSDVKVSQRQADNRGYLLQQAREQRKATLKELHIHRKNIEKIDNQRTISKEIRSRITASRERLVLERSFPTSNKEAIDAKLSGIVEYADGILRRAKRSGYNLDALVDLRNEEREI